MDGVMRHTEMLRLMLCQTDFRSELLNAALESAMKWCIRAVRPLVLLQFIVCGEHFSTFNANLQRNSVVY